MKVERVRVDTGRRELVRTITPPNAEGATAVYGFVAAADDLNVYAYAVDRQLSRLFLIQGGR
jgi:hypothetical protein